MSSGVRPAGSAGPISHMDLPARLEDGDATKALVTWNNNIAASSPQQRRIRQALAREDLFHVAVDLFPTDTTDFADIVLPASSFLEFDDLVLSYFNYSVSAQVKAVETIGQSLPNQEIFRRLARAMGLSDPALFESDAKMLERLMQQINIGETFASLASKGTVPYTSAPVVPFANLKLATPSGKIEIVSERFAALGLPRAPIPHADKKPAPGKLRLLSPASAWLLNSSYSNDSRIEERLKRASVALHPDEAAARGVAEGSPVALINDVGRLSLNVTISEAVPMGVALVHKGRWPKLDVVHHEVNQGLGGAPKDRSQARARSRRERIRHCPYRRSVRSGACARSHATDYRGQSGNRQSGNRPRLAHDGGAALSGGMPYHYIPNRILAFLDNIVFGTRMAEFRSGYMLYSRPAA